MISLDAFPKTKSCSYISGNEDYLVIKSRRFHVLNRMACSLTEYKEIHAYAGKIAFLPCNRLLVKGGSDHRYHLIFMDTGEIHSSAVLSRTSFLSARRFVISPDYSFAYDFFTDKGKHYLLKINLNTMEYSRIYYEPELRLAKDMICVGENEIWMLQTKTDNVDGVTRCIGAIVSLIIEGKHCTSTVLHTWIDSASGMACRTDGRYILREDMTVLDLHTQKTVNLLANGTVKGFQPKRVLSIHFYSDQNLLQLVDGEQNVFIDCHARCVIARYVTRTDDGGGYQGYLVDGQFLIGTEKGFVVKPFPLIE